ncbi:pyridoxal-phosphate dependent enzyme [Salinibacterium sp. M195]|nr:pyridoxal-phosphate dependent enzyme [Salinibacterium sp. M195]
MWRFADRLPSLAPENIVSLGEGGTPQLDLTGVVPGLEGLARFELKMEDRNPTGSFKARIASLALSLAREHNLRGALGTSSGNGGAAAAAYSAAAGLEAVLLVLRGALESKVREIRAYGARVIEVDGLGHDADATIATAMKVAAAAERFGYTPMLTGFRFAPEAMRAIHTIAWEIDESAAAADHVFAPVGGGGLVAGLSQGFLSSERTPRVFGVHPDGMDGLISALEGDPIGRARGAGTEISGLQMAALYDGPSAAAGIRATGGAAVAVSDAQVYEAQRDLAALGILVEPAGATSLAGARQAFSTGLIDRSARVVAVVSGAGYKDPQSIERFARQAEDAPVSASDLDRLLETLLTQENPR